MARLVVVNRTGKIVTIGTPIGTVPSFARVVLTHLTVAEIERVRHQLQYLQSVNVIQYATSHDDDVATDLEYAFVSDTEDALSTYRYTVPVSIKYDFPNGMSGVAAVVGSTHYDPTSDIATHSPIFFEATGRSVSSTVIELWDLTTPIATKRATLNASPVNGIFYVAMPIIPVTAPDVNAGEISTVAANYEVRCIPSSDGTTLGWSGLKIG